MPDTISQTDLENAKVDAQTIDDVANGAADLNGTGLATSRTGGDKRTLAKLEADFQAVIDVQEIQEQAATAASLTAQQAVQNLSQGHYGSVMFADENEEAPLLESSSLLYLANSATGGAADISGGANGAMWSQAGGTLAIGWELPTEKYNRLNRQPILIGNHTSFANRGFHLKCTPPGTGLSPFANNYSFQFGINGNSGTSSPWACSNAAVPQTVRRIVPVARHDNTNMWLDILDVDAGIWYRGNPVAKPAGFVGLSNPTYPMSIGRPTVVANPSTAFPADFNTGGIFTPQGITSPRGSFVDALIADTELTDADILAIYQDGDSVLSTVGASDLRFHAPLATAGMLDLSVTSSIPEVDGEELTLVGTISPGATFKRQGASYFHMEAIPQPGFIALEHGQEKAKHTWTAEVAGLASADPICEFRIVTREGSATDWQECEYSLDGTTASIDTYLPDWIVSQCQIQFRFDSDPSLICATHSDIQIGLHVLLWSQSEGVYALQPGDRTGAESVATVDGEILAQAPGAETLTFVNVDNGISSSRRRPGLLGPSAIHFCNLIRQATDKPMLFAMHMISGTSLRDLMDDSVGGRQWADEERVHQFVLNRRDDGSIPTSGSIKIGWEAADNVAAYGRDVNFPWYRGRVYPGSSFAFNIDHYLHDGTFSPTMKCVELPCNRATSGSGSGASTDTTGQNSGEMLQRASQLQWGHEAGYEVGRTETLHAMEAEVGGVLAGAGVTHPRGDDWDGDLRMAAQVADAVNMIAGVSKYPGVVKFESIIADPDDANSVILTLGPPRKHPGFGLANPDTETRLDAEIYPSNLAYRLQTNKAGGNAKWFFEAKRVAADPFAINTLVSATIIGGDQVRCTFSSAVVPGETAIWVHPGNMQYDSSIVNQEDLRDGGLIFYGEQYAPGQDPGMQVTGSHEALVLPA